MLLRFLLAATASGAFAIAGRPADGTGTSPAAASAVTATTVPNTSLGQILIAFDSTSGRLEYWPFGTGGSAQWLSRPLPISDATGMVANGDTVYIASDSPPAIVSYDVDTKKTTTLSGPYGAPRDIAIDRSADVYHGKYRDRGR